jgi:hypothetical protein
MSYDLCGRCGRPAAKCGCPKPGVICVRVGDHPFIDSAAPRHGGTKGECGACGAAVWHTPVADFPADARLVCVQCAGEYAAGCPAAAVVITPGALDATREIVADWERTQAERN